MISDPNLEKALIARLLYDPDQLPLVRLSAEDFSVADWGNAFRAMVSLTSEHRTIDIATLGALCPGVDLKQLLDEISPAHRASVEEYADQIRDMAHRRRLLAMLEGVIRRGQDADTQTLLSDLSAAVSSALAGASGDKLVSSEQAVSHYLATDHSRRGLHWAPPSLNDIIQPAQGGEVVVVAARPSVGKTVVAEMTADAWATESGKPVLFASLEMGLSKLLERAIARAGLPRGTSPEAAGATLLARKGVWYLDNPRATTTDLRAAASKVKMVKGSLGGIVVDYIGLFKDRNDNEVQRIARISAELKALAREHDVPLMVLSQLNRNSTRRDDEHPRMEDIRDSGAVEQDADIILGLHRKIGAEWMAVSVLKNRDGVAGIRKNLHFDQERVLLS